MSDDAMTKAQAQRLALNTAAELRETRGRYRTVLKALFATYRREYVMCLVAEYGEEKVLAKLKRKEL